MKNVFNKVLSFIKTMIVRIGLRLHIRVEFGRSEDRNNDSTKSAEGESTNE